MAYEEETGTADKASAAKENTASSWTQEGTEQTGVYPGGKCKTTPQTAQKKTTPGGCTAAPVCACICCGVTSAVFFKIAAVQVTGDTGRYSSEQLIGTSGIVSGDNMFSFKAGTVENAIESAFPYIENVKVKRRLPSVVEISVQQAQPAKAYQDANGSYTLISASGKVLETGASKPEGVMEITGFPLRDVSAGQYLDAAAFPDLDTLSQITDALSQWGMEGAQAIDLSDKFNIKIKYNEKVTIALGSVSQISYKLQFAKYVLDNGLKENETVVIDASTAGQAVVKPVDPAASQNTSSKQTDSPESSPQSSPASSRGNRRLDELKPEKG